MSTNEKYLNLLLIRLLVMANRGSVQSLMRMHGNASVPSRLFWIFQNSQNLSEYIYTTNCADRWYLKQSMRNEFFLQPVLFLPNIITEPITLIKSQTVNACGVRFFYNQVYGYQTVQTNNISNLHCEVSLMKTPRVLSLWFLRSDPSPL